MTAPVTQLDPRTWAIQGTTLRLPVEVRDSQITASIFRCPAEDARAVLGGTPFQPLTVRSSAFAAVMFIRYIDGDLGAYDEFGVGVIVRGQGGGKPGICVLHLPVTAEFTMHAGRWIWGLPKYLVDSGCNVERNQLRVALSSGGTPIVTGAIKTPRRIPGKVSAPSVGWSTATEGADVGSVLQTPGLMTLRNMRLGRRGTSLMWGDDPMSRDALRLRMHGTPLISVQADAQLSIDAATKIS